MQGLCLSPYPSGPLHVAQQLTLRKDGDCHFHRGFHSPHHRLGSCPNYADRNTEIPRRKDISPTSQWLSTRAIGPSEADLGANKLAP